MHLWKVEVWDDLGWTIARGKISPDDAVRAIGEALSIRSLQQGDPLMPAPLLMCTLEGDHGPSGGGRAAFAVRVLENEGALGSGVTPTAATGAAAGEVTMAMNARVGKQAHPTAPNPAVDMAEGASTPTEGRTALTKTPSPTKQRAVPFDDIDDLLFSSRGTDPASLGLSSASPGESDFDLSSFDDGGLGDVAGRSSAVEASVTYAEEAAGASFVARDSHSLLVPGSTAEGGTGYDVRPTHSAADVEKSEPTQEARVRAAVTRKPADPQPATSTHQPDVSDGYSEDGFDCEVEEEMGSHQPPGEESVISFSTACSLEEAGVYQTAGDSDADQAERVGNGSADSAIQEINRQIRDESAINVAAGRLRQVFGLSHIVLRVGLSSAVIPRGADYSI